MNGSMSCLRRIAFLVAGYALVSSGCAEPPPREQTNTTPPPSLPSAQETTPVANHSATSDLSNSGPAGASARGPGGLASEVLTAGSEGTTVGNAGNAPLAAGSATTPAPAGGKEVVQAGTKTTKRGRMDKADGGYLHVVVTARNYAKNAIEFDKLKHAEQIWSALNDGEMPATEEQYFKEIVEANQIALPALPEGHRYFYDTKEHQLMVERPAGEE